MIRAVVLFLAPLLGAAASADAGSPAGTHRESSPSEVLAELSRRSGMPEAELRMLIADCSANQQSMYFCA